MEHTQDPYATQVGGSHYKHFAIQPGEYIKKNKLTWYEANAVKYITRARYKGQRVQDLEKALHYIQMELQDAREDEKQ
jgi:hypothetical protein